MTYWKPNLVKYICSINHFNYHKRLFCTFKYYFFTFVLFFVQKNKLLSLSRSLQCDQTYVTKFITLLYKTIHKICIKILLLFTVVSNYSWKPASITLQNPRTKSKGKERPCKIRVMNVTTLNKLLSVSLCCAFEFKLMSKYCNEWTIFDLYMDGNSCWMFFFAFTMEIFEYYYYYTNT